ncbi:helix-turn-helix domain-containing protein [Myroides odoratimimus]|uniref:helix-turn-helix domain-containing protein n=1 Tax=Myroides odoratimimus TaxID=76832 RepID=UPI002DBCF57A|nr:helix-turn-helix transcriptional regulator [Myroides odoratimimus]MEC4094753.1 helix-turn-helix transcriptional regulator [Myroides odoratimimus]
MVHFNGIVVQYGVEYPPIAIKNKIETRTLMKVSPFKQEIRKTNPHKHNNYFEIIYLSEGTGSHTIDQNVFSITTPTIFFIRKEQVHFWDITSKPKGFVLLLKKEFLQTSLDYKLRDLLSQLSHFTCLKINETQGINTLFQLLVSEKDFTVKEGVLKALLAKIIATSIPFSSSVNKNDTASLFQDFLKQTDNLHSSVAYYAKKIGISPQNLNAICRKTFKQPASEILAEHIIDEAKRQLLYSENSISEIAYNLNFSDSSYFTKYFKRYVGTTPKVFREL